MNNYNITGVNTLLIEDPGPTEGLIFNGTQAKVVVSPLDASNADGYLRLVNDGGISLESSVRIIRNLQMEAGAGINLRDSPIRGSAIQGLSSMIPAQMVYCNGVVRRLKFMSHHRTTEIQMDIFD